MEAQATLDKQAAWLNTYRNYRDPHRGSRRRARHPRIQHRARCPPRLGGRQLPRQQGRRRRRITHQVVRQGAPGRDLQRHLVLEPEPPRGDGRPVDEKPPGRFGGPGRDSRKLEAGSVGAAYSGPGASSILGASRSRFDFAAFLGYPAPVAASPETPYPVSFLSLKRGWPLRLAAAVLVTVGLRVAGLRAEQPAGGAARAPHPAARGADPHPHRPGRGAAVPAHPDADAASRRCRPTTSSASRSSKAVPTGKPEAATQSGGDDAGRGVAAGPNAAAVPADPALTPVPGLEAPVAGDPLGTPMDDAAGRRSRRVAGPAGRHRRDRRRAARTADARQHARSRADPDAQAQYNAGYDAVVRGDYAFAEEQFRQFVALYPNDPQAADATNWLGEALLQRGAYDEAADVALTGFQNYPNSPRAPDLLMKVGVALAAVGERDAACRTFVEVREPLSGARSRPSSTGSPTKRRRPSARRRAETPAALFARRVFAPLADYRTVGLAVSGGPDSLALMLLAAEYARSARAPRSSSTPSTTASVLRPPTKSAFVVREAERLGFRGPRAALGRAQAEDRHPGGGPRRPLRADRATRCARTAPRCSSPPTISATRPRPC